MAIYAKATLTDKTELLHHAAKLVPDNPTYVFSQVPSGFGAMHTEMIEAMADLTEDKKAVQTVEGIKQQEANRGRRLIERTLRLDPSYLPALYKYAVGKPTHEQKIQLLEKIAEIDADNAKPYYVMAILQYQKAIEGRETTQESGRNAYPMTEQEWKLILDLIKQGNQRPAFRATTARIPSIDDVRVSTNGKVWPRKAVESMLCVNTEAFGPIGGPEDLPWSCHVYFRRIAGQAAWQARLAYRQGKHQEALDILQTAHTMADKLACSEPFRLLPLLTASAMHSNIRGEERIILQVPADPEGIRRINNQRADWRKIIREYNFEATQVTVKDVKYSPTEPLTYTDFVNEESQVKEALRKLELLR